MNAENLKLVACERLREFIEDRHSDIVNYIFRDSECDISYVIESYVNEAIDDVAEISESFADILRYAVKYFDFNAEAENFEECVFGVRDDHLEIDAFGLRREY